MEIINQIIVSNYEHYNNKIYIKHCYQALLSSTAIKHCYEDLALLILLSNISLLCMVMCLVRALEKLLL